MEKHEAVSDDHTQPYHSFMLELRPGRKLHVALYDEMTPNAVRTLLLRFFPKKQDKVSLSTKADSTAKTNASSEHCTRPFSATLIDGEYVLSRLHLLVAATNALYRSGNPAGSNGLKTRSINSELLLCLSGKRSIDSALRSFGLKESSKRLIVCSFDDPAPLLEVVAELQQFVKQSSITLAEGDTTFQRKVSGPTIGSWSEFETLSTERMTMFLTFFKVGKEELALIEYREKQEEKDFENKSMPKKRRIEAGTETRTSLESNLPVRWIASLESAVITRLGIQAHEKGSF